MSEYVETWRAIAAACDRSETWCHRMATLVDDPLPVQRAGRRGLPVRVLLADLKSWLGREHDDAWADQRYYVSVRPATADRVRRGAQRAGMSMREYLSIRLSDALDAAGAP